VFPPNVPFVRLAGAGAARCSGSRVQGSGTIADADNYTLLSRHVYEK